MDNVRNMNDTESTSYKLIMLHINDSQVRMLEDFFAMIDIYYYTIESNVKRAIEKNIKHQQTKVWPGSDALITFPIGDKKLDELLIKLKTFRMALPKGIVMSVAIIPFERVIKSLYNADIPIDNELFNEIQDKEWEEPVLKLIKKAKVPVVPMYFHAKNSELFYKVAKLHPDLQTLMIPAEMLNKRERPIKIRIGRPVTPKVQNEYESVQDLGRFLRKKVYMMKSYFEDRKSVAEFLKVKDLNIMPQKEEVVQNIIDETPLSEILADIENLRKKEGKMLFSNGEYEVYFTKFDEIPAMMREIGRQRELTFRAVGEGTNLPFDLDEYDKHYCHLILWDNAQQKIAGAYRMALGAEVMKNYGIKGFYTSSLFDFDQELQPFFRKIIEMGRAYITLEYQQKPLPLFLLWKGIVHVCLRNPEHKFLMGGVSISNGFSDFSKSLMIEFMRSHYYDAVVAQHVRPKNEYKVHLSERDKELFFEGVDNDLNKFDKLIDDFEPELRLPVLIKKYIKQNAKVVAFNVDPNFNDAVDGLMYIRISDLPESTIKPVLEELAEQLKENEKNEE